MKATYLKNYKKVIQAFFENSISFIANNEPVGFHQYIDEATNNKKLTISHWGGHYSNPLTPVFLYQIKTLSQLAPHPILFCRDGFFCLIDFFHRFPSPRELKTIFIINSAFSEHIPSAWKNNVVFYELGLLPQFNYKDYEATQDSLIIKGALLTSDRESTDLNAYILEMIQSVRPSKFKKIKVCLWSRDDYFLNNRWAFDADQSKRLNNFFPKLHEMFYSQKDVEFLDFPSLLNLKSYHRYSYLDILPTKAQYIGDDLTDFVLLSRGVFPVTKLEKVSLDKEEFIPLSAYHGYRILPFSKIDDSKVSKADADLTLIKKKFAIEPNDNLTSDFFAYLGNIFKFENVGIKHFSVRR